MANTLGSLVVNLGLNAAEFTTGLTKAEYQSEQFARKMDANFRSIAKLIGSIGIGALIGKFVSDTISAAAALDDLSDATGSSVESLSKLANQTKISGRNFEELQSIMLKLAAGMAGADDESSNVGRALAALDVATRDPAQALQEIAIALNKYADGVGKAAIARDLFGKNGPAFLATLKDIANLQDVSATKSREQAAEAERLEQALRKLRVESTLMADALLNIVVPALNNVIERFKLARTAGLGFIESMNLATINTSDATSLPAMLKRAREELEKLQDRLAYSQRRGFGAAEIIPDLTKAQQRLEALKAIQRQVALSGAEKLGYTGDVRDYLANKKPTLDYTGGKKDAVVDEYAKAIENLGKAATVAQLELNAAATGADNLTEAEKTLARLQNDKVWTSFNETQRKTFEDAYKGVAIIEKQTTALKKQADDRAEAIRKELAAYEALTTAQQHADEAATKALGDYAEQNEAIRRQVEIVGQDEIVHNKLAAALEYEKLKQQALATGNELTLEALKKQYEIRLKLIDALDAANKKVEEQMKTKQFADDLASAFGRAEEEAVVFGRTARDVLRGLEQDLVRIINRKLVLEPLEKLFSSFLAGDKGGGGLFQSLLSYLSSGTGGSPYTEGSPNFVGPIQGAAANGLDYARGGMYKVGEYGAEVIRVPRGSQVIPHDRLLAARQARGGGDINVSVSMPAGVSKQTAAQLGAEVARGLAYAGRNT